MKPILKVPVVNGAIAGALGAVFMIVLFFFGRHPFLIPVYLDFRILLFVFFLFFTLKEFRDLHQTGVLYFWQGLIICSVFVLVYGIVASTLIGIFATAYPEFVSSYILKQTEIIKSLPAETVQQIGKEVFDRNLNALPATDAADLASLYFSQSLMIGFFLNIIMSVFLRKT